MGNEIPTLHIERQSLRTIRSIQATNRMSISSTFRFNRASFSFGTGQRLHVDLVADKKTNPKNTHFTLIMGANGTCKSRLLSCCVNLLKSIDERERARTVTTKVRHLHLADLDQDMQCESATLLRDGVSGTIQHGEDASFSTLLPSRVLAIANLVRDRFTFVDWSEFDEPFYYYLGVRQASNLTTTGAMDRIVTDAVLAMLDQDDRFVSFSKWTKAVFPLSELGLAFSGFIPRKLERGAENPEQMVKRYFGHFRSGDTHFVKSKVDEINQHREGIRELGELINFHGQVIGDAESTGMKRGGTRTLCLDQLSPSVRSELGRLRHALRLACNYRLIGRPSLVHKVKKWLDFTKLSSGEQNILATGARLLAYATPGSMVVIDEPEVSLNVAWQQRYIDLVAESLSHANGSHVIIASHSPYLVSDLRSQNSTVVVVERVDGSLKCTSQAGEFWGWGSEAILYEVLGVPSASNYHFSRELAAVLKLVREKSKNAEAFQKFLRKCDQLDFGPDSEPLKVVIDEVRTYAGAIGT